MPHIRLIREVTNPGRSGPPAGMYALQRALRAVAPEWFHIGGALEQDEIPWYWSWLERDEIVARDKAGLPYVQGPCVLFHWVNQPRAIPAEAVICNSTSCLLSFTESDWYQRLILQNYGPLCQTPIVLWPFPIDPVPAGPVAPEYDLLIYAKSGVNEVLVDRLARAYPRSAVLRYGTFDRPTLANLAQRSLCCAYLSNSDRGPLALAEIMLSGCPAIGTHTGAPWIIPGTNGTYVERLAEDACVDAVDDVLRRGYDRQCVRDWALSKFDGEKTARFIIEILRSVVRM